MANVQPALPAAQPAALPANIQQHFAAMGNAFNQMANQATAISQQIAGVPAIANVGIAQQMQQINTALQNANLPQMALNIAAIQTRQLQMDNRQQQMDNRQQQMNNRQQQMDNRLRTMQNTQMAFQWNSKAMLRNSKISHATTPLAPLQHPVTNVPINPFPLNIQALESLDRAHLITLLTNLGAPPPMNRRRKTQLLRAARIELGLSEA